MDTDEKTAKSISKLLSLVLRHKPQKIGIDLDKQGFTDIDKLIKNINEFGHLRLLITREAIDEVVKTNDKKRFEISADGTKIRAVQGHSAPMVQIDFVASTPPNPLYHGTAHRFLTSIRQQGLLPQTRQYVHLSTDIATAQKVGARHGKVQVLVIDTAKMCADGFEFYQANNGVWLTQCVPCGYFGLLNCRN